MAMSWLGMRWANGFSIWSAGVMRPVQLLGRVSSHWEGLRDSRYLLPSPLAGWRTTPLVAD